MNQTEIDYVDVSWNCTTGCTDDFPCWDYCWARKMAKRLAHNPSVKHCERYDGFRPAFWPERLDEPLRMRKPKRIAVSFMGDIGHSLVCDDWLVKVFGTILACPQHTFLILTKRPKRLAQWLNDPRVPGKVGLACDMILVEKDHAEEVEEIVPITDFPDYFISNYGKVFSETRGRKRRQLKPGPDKDGHLQVMLCKDKTVHPRYVHRLVLTAFVGPATPGSQVRHLNDDPSDNRLSNLRWGTGEDNWIDRRNHGTRAGCVQVSDQQIAEIRWRYDAGETQVSIAASFGLSNTLIGLIGKRRHPRKCGPRWPPPNVWLGTSIANQADADLRLPDLLKCPGNLWVSCEPIRGPVVFKPEWLKRIGWLVAGGGPFPLQPDWVRSIRDQCQAAGVPFWFKQWGAVGIGCGLAGNPMYVAGYQVCEKQGGDVLDGREHHELPEESPCQ